MPTKEWNINRIKSFIKKKESCQRLLDTNFSILLVASVESLRYNEIINDFRQAVMQLEIIKP
jgi:hypothetical protein